MSDKFKLNEINPALFLLIGYLSYLLIGWIALCLPHVQSEDLSVLDNLFMATSALSTTGLVTVDTGVAYNIWGQAIILLLIQLGGIGYMTFGSFIVLSIRNKVSTERLNATKTAFALPEDFKVSRFIRTVIVFTLSCEIIGAGLLYAIFTYNNVDSPLWMAVFHSISAFCTAGFSLFSDSFEAFKFNPYINIVIATLSYLGAIGFLVMADTWNFLRGRKDHLYFTTKIILKVTFLFSVVGTALFFLLEPSIQSFEPWQRLIVSFFQIMTAATTVGFNTLPIGSLAPAIVMFMYFLMIFGASPSGTGGGLKSTTMAILGAIVRSVIKRRNSIRLRKREITADALHLAAASFIFYMLTLLIAMILLLTTQNTGPDGHAFEAIMFEVISAMGTVGLSMGLTGDLTPLGKLIVILLMFMGRIGILTFGIAVSMKDETRKEEKDCEILI